MTIPANNIAGARLVILNATIWAVTVVPIFAPIPTKTACVMVIRLALTNPMSMTVVALELWMTAVTPAPRPTAAKRLDVRVSRPLLSLSPAAASRLSDISFMPYKNNPNPPNNASICTNSIYKLLQKALRALI